MCSSFFILGCNAVRGNVPKSVRVTYAPKRFRSFETTVKLTFRFGRSHKQENANGKVIRLKVFNRKKFVTGINKTLSVNETQLEISCEVFATPGRYFIEYFIQGLTKTFILLTARPIIVRRERAAIDVQKNHTAFDGPLSAWLNSKHGRCKPFRGKLKLYWIKNSKEHILVTKKRIDKDNFENRTRVNFRCNLFDTAGTFYFVYISDYNNRTIGRSQNMSVSWGKYEITAQSKNIFPCSSSFVIKFSSPYCDRTEDKIEMRSRAYNNLINSQTAFHGFRSAFFKCEVFKQHIREYCFSYVTKSSMSKKRKIQTTLCVPTKKTGMCHKCVFLYGGCGCGGCMRVACPIIKPTAQYRSVVMVAYGAFRISLIVFFLHRVADAICTSLIYRHYLFSLCRQFQPDLISNCGLACR